MNSKRFIEAAEFPDFSRCRRFRTPRYPSIHSGRLRRSLMDSRQWTRDRRAERRQGKSDENPRSREVPADAINRRRVAGTGMGRSRNGPGRSGRGRRRWGGQPAAGMCRDRRAGRDRSPVGPIADVMTRMESCRRPVCRFYSARTRYPPIRRHRAPPRESPHALPYASISICTAHKLMRMPGNKPSVAHERDDR